MCQRNTPKPQVSSLTNMYKLIQTPDQCQESKCTQHPKYHFCPLPITPSQGPHYPALGSFCLTLISPYPIILSALLSQNFFWSINEIYEKKEIELFMKFKIKTVAKNGCQGKFRWVKHKRWREKNRNLKGYYTKIALQVSYP